MKKGFTLIELLAVIVVLAIIAIIAIPIVLNAVTTATKGSTERTVDNYIHSVENKIADLELKNTPLIDGIYSINSNGNLTNGTDEFQIEMKGTKPNNGLVTIKNSAVEDIFTNIKDYRLKLVDSKVKASDNKTWALILPQDATNGYVNHIETNIRLNQIGKIELDFAIVNPITTVSHPMLFRNSEPTTPYISMDKTTGNIVLNGLSGSTATPSQLLLNGSRQNLTLNISNQTNNNTLWYGSWQDVSWSQRQKVYSLKIYGQDKKTLLFYGIPVPKDNDEFSQIKAPSNCLYDYVSQQYFINKGAGTFAIEPVSQ